LRFTADYYRALVGGQLRGFGPALERGALRLLSVPYGSSVLLRNWLYQRGWKGSVRAVVPVVSVGNLTLGGTGKTPCVEYVAGWFRDRGRAVAILSRGYAGSGGRNDEALVLEANLPDVPHLQGANRARLAAAAAAELGSEILVLDDGFQHRALRRDLDLVLIDVTNPWGPGYLFPRGLLREPLSGLGRADLVLLTRCDQVSRSECQAVRDVVRRRAPGCPVVETSHQPIELMDGLGHRARVEELARRPVAAFCGIGNPAAFRRTLGRLGADLRAFRVYPDHHAYTQADVNDLRRWAGQQAKECTVLTTQKDLVKLQAARLDRPLWALRIALHLETGQEALDRKLTEVLDAGATPLQRAG
jgi:tetraacyldisaccharide 4'-kinase